MGGSTESEHLGRRVALAGIVASALLATLNLVVGAMTRSTSVLAIGAEFAGDVLASSVVLIGMTVAARPADQEHPYGHGRVETLAAFLVGVILVGGGIGVCWTSLRAVGEVHAPPSALAIVALVVAVVVRGGMSALKFRVGRQLRSASLVADAWNDAVDILAAAAALTAVGLARHDSVRFLAADHYGGFAVGLVVILTGLRVLRSASLELMDTMPEPAAMEALRTTALEVPGVRGVDKCYARKTGFSYHVDLHVEVDPELTVRASHAIAGQVRSLVRERLGWVADVLVHVEPAVPPASGERFYPPDSPG
ncbi:MAG: cation diffusion facilitator family transporter [Gemmatimonadales bacterium]